ncbi:MAG: hypothetical protein WKG07_07060 [Hymenobacter sp.]
MAGRRRAQSAHFGGHAYPPPPAERRNSLNLIFMVGGILLLLGIVAYLAPERQPPSEHLTSTSQTAADSTAVVLEVGPQAEQITPPPWRPPRPCAWPR